MPLTFDELFLVRALFFGDCPSCHGSIRVPTWHCIIWRFFSERAFSNGQPFAQWPLNGPRPSHQHPDESPSVTVLCGLLLYVHQRCLHRKNSRNGTLRLKWFSRVLANIRQFKRECSSHFSGHSQWALCASTFCAPTLRFFLLGKVYCFCSLFGLLTKAPRFVWCKVCETWTFLG